MSASRLGRAQGVVLVLASLLFLAACATSVPGFADRKIRFPSPGKALVYAYRVSNGRWVGRVGITLDAHEFTEIGDGECSECQVTPGKHLFRAEWGLMSKPLMEGDKFDAKTLELTAEAGGTYYLCYSILEDGQPAGMLEQSGLLGKALSKSHVLSVDFRSTEKEAAMLDLPGCNLVDSQLPE